jgi:hypothetical protein
MRIQYPKLFFISLSFFFCLEANAQSIWRKLTDFAPANSLTNLSEGQNHTIYGRSLDGWIYYLPNNSEEWIPLENIPSGSDIQKVEADPNSNRLYATTGSWGLLYSTNQGQTWSVQNFNNANPNNGMVPRISYLKGLDNKLFVSFPLYQNNGSVFSKIYYSTTGASTHQLIGTLNTYVYDVEFINTNQNELWIATQHGLYYTQNILNSSINLIAFEDQQVVRIETSGNNLFAAVYDGTLSLIYQSSDFGNTWNLLPNQPELKMVWDMEMTGNNLMISSQSGLYSYANENWQIISELTSSESLASQGNKSIASGTRLMGSLVYNTQNQNVQNIQNGLNLNMNSAVLTNNQKIYTSSFVSNTLSHFDLNSHQWYSQTIPENVEDYTIIHGLSKSSDGNCLVGMNGFLLETRSDSNSLNVIGTNQTAPNDPVYGIFNPAEIYTNDLGIYIRQHSIQTTLNFTADQGQNWSIIDPSTSGYSYFLMTQIHAQNESIYMLGAASGFPQDVLIRSTNNGQSWIQIPQPTNETILKIFTSKTDELFCHTNFDKLHKWDSQSNSWTLVNVELGNNAGKYIDLNFDLNNRLHIVTSGKTAPLSTDGIHIENSDGSFEHVPFPTDNGLSLPLYKLDFNEDNIMIGITRNTIGNHKSGIYYYSENPLLHIIENNQVQNQIRIFPNPTNDKLNIISPNKSWEFYQITDVNGRAIKNGKFQNSISVKDLPKGIYVLILMNSTGQKVNERFIVR